MARAGWACRADLLSLSRCRGRWQGGPSSLKALGPRGTRAAQGPGPAVRSLPACPQAGTLVAAWPTVPPGLGGQARGLR